MEENHFGGEKPQRSVKHKIKNVFIILVFIIFFISTENKLILLK